MNKSDFEKLNGNGTIYHVTKKDKLGRPLRARLNGYLKTWKTRPLEFKQPMKYGMYEYFYITEMDADQWKLLDGLE